MDLDEAEAVRALKKGSEAALAWLMDRYTPYVNAVVSNIIGQWMSEADIEEVDADVFVALWNHAAEVRAPSVKSWLGSVARNAAKNRLRALGRELPLEEDILLPAGEGPEELAERRELRRLVAGAVLGMGEPDREIFLRHYYYGQTVERIAAALHMSASAVKVRLCRGRKKLRGVLGSQLADEGGDLDAIKL